MTALPRGGTLVIGAGPEMHSGLTSAVTSAGTAQIISAKLFDGLLSYDEHFGPQPQFGDELGHRRRRAVPDASSASRRDLA